MKTLIVAVAVLVNSIVSAQEINYDKFDYALLKSLISQKINEYRVSKGLKACIVSDPNLNKISAVTTSRNAADDKLYHPGLALGSMAEIIGELHGAYTSYEQMATQIVKLWINSTGHRHIIEIDSIDIFGCDIKKSKTNKFYVAVNFGAI